LSHAPRLGALRRRDRFGSCACNHQWDSCPSESFIRKSSRSECQPAVRLRESGAAVLREGCLWQYSLGGTQRSARRSDARAPARSRHMASHSMGVGRSRCGWKKIGPKAFPAPIPPAAIGPSGHRNVGHLRAGEDGTCHKQIRCDQRVRNGGPGGEEEASDGPSINRCRVPTPTSNKQRVHVKDMHPPHSRANDHRLMTPGRNARCTARSPSDPERNVPLGIGTSPPLSSTPLAVAIKRDRGHCRRLVLRWELYSRDSLVIIQK